MFVYAVVLFGFEEWASGMLAGLFHLGVYGPTVVLSITAGIILDRVRRDRVLLATMMAIGICIAIVAALSRFAGTDEPGMMAMLMVGAVVVYGSFFVALRPAFYAVLSTLADREHLGRDTVSVTLVSSATYPLAPIAVGLLRPVLDWPALFGVMALLAATAMLLGLVRLGDIDTGTAEGPKAAAGLRGDVTELLELLRNHPVIFQLLILLSLACVMLFGPFQVLIPDLAASVLRLDEMWQGVYMGVLGAGVVFGTALSYRIRSSEYLGIWLLWCTAAGALVSLGVALGSTLVSTICLFAASTAMGILISLVTVVIQQATPDGFRGRLLGIYTLLFTGLTAIGGFAAGVLADMIPMPVLLPAISVSCTVLTIALWLSTDQLQNYSGRDSN